MSNGIDFGHQDGVDLRDLLTAMVDNIRTLINANDKSYNQRFDNVTSATQAALAASDRAVSKAELASEKRFDAVNEFRATLADQQRNLMPRNEVDILIKGLSDRIDSNTAAVTDSRLGSAQFLTVANYQNRHEELQKQVDDLKLSRAELMGKANQSSVNQSFIFAAIGIALSAAALLHGFLK